jgi:hypothetical protein
LVLEIGLYPVDRVVAIRFESDALRSKDRT